ncbi:hypothetical protein Goklo_028661 [Gossypium klotzschianum]|uniref:Uncharacterized protein n=2 Tax=Gossypium TaxID=3633 RepID=A0A7J8U2J9_9ROSI|nr:hypothetical protein [Gossypium klotzschianum]
MVTRVSDIFQIEARAIVKA